MTQTPQAPQAAQTERAPQATQAAHIPVAADPLLADLSLSKSYRTKMKIAQSMDVLCAETPYTRLTVDDIVKSAGLSRSGFYHHFEDKDAVILWLTRLFYLHGVDQIGRTLTWFEGYLVTTRSFTRFRRLFSSEAENSGYASGREFYRRHRRENLTETLCEYQQRELTNELRAQIEILPEIEIAASGRYDKGQWQMPLKDYCNLACSLVPRTLYEALENPVQRELTKGDLYFNV
ncbi:MAG: TetR/AcrR family transcriptional regulator [Coriobacteriales bacterium]|jgi:AcrR family transcriptional regulator|nr:TetR/AcrR family transcriptional regulator [Coriobacteriales bacterium]